MRFGNTSDLSSKQFAIFEIDRTPEFITTNGKITGSGDQLFLTSSFAQRVSARYLQMRFTLRTDFTGSV